MSLTRGIALAIAWLVSIALAGGVGFSLGLYDARQPAPAGGNGAAPVPAGSRAVENEHADPRRSASVQPPVAPPVDEAARPAAEPSATPPPARPSAAAATDKPVVASAERRRPEPTPQPSAPPDAAAPAPSPPPVEAEPAEPEPAAARGATLERARSVERLADADDLDRARTEAVALVGEHESYTALAAALVADGADGPRAQLIAVRMLQLAGEDALSRQLARELRRSYSATAEVGESIRRFGILSPRILSATPSIEGSQLVVTGEIENPDVGQVRRLRVQVEALDAGGNRLATVEARVRPNVLPAEGRGAFTAVFKRLDPASVLRTRASVVEWESELIGGAEEPPPPRSTETAD